MSTSPKVAASARMSGRQAGDSGDPTGFGEETERRFFRNPEAVYPYLFMLPALVLVVVVFAYPIFHGFNESLHTQTLTGENREFVGLDTYREVFERPAFWNAMTRSLIFVTGSIVVGTFLALVFALVLYYAPVFKRTLRVISLIPWLVSGVAVAWIFRFLFNSDVGIAGRVTRMVGLEVGTWLGSPTLAIVVVIAANVWYIVPFGALLLLAGLQMLDQDLFDAAKVDGASPSQLFRRVTFPQLLPHLGIVLVVFSFAAWNTFDLVLAMTEGGPRGTTEVLGVYMYKRAFRALQFSEGAVLMTIILLINVVLSVGYLYFLRRDD